jgi:hypothetical protein
MCKADEKIHSDTLAQPFALPQKSSLFNSEVMYNIKTVPISYRIMNF